jgi:putative DNA primase/helicase
VIFAYDSDIVTNPSVQRAESSLAEVLQSEGAMVKTIRLPGGPNGSKTGLDDFLAANGAESLQQLIDKATTVDPGPNVPLDNPHRLAGEFIQSLGERVLRYYMGEFLEYRDGAYYPLSDECLHSEITRWVDAEFLRINRKELALWLERKTKGTLSKGERQPKVRAITTAVVNNVLQAIKGLKLLPDSIKPPAWIDGRSGPNPAKILSMRNGLLNLDAAIANSPECLLPATPSFFTRTALPFDFDPNAAKPCGWLRFIGTVWPTDQESVATLQEWLGYLLAQDTRQEKILLVIGPKRSGKGTISKILRELVGEFNSVNPTLGSLSGNFGLEPLLGKSVAIVSDARLSGRADEAIIVENLLSISGNDPQTVARKHRSSVNGRLPVRFVILSNELPRLKDKSGALPGRFIILRMVHSFFGKEDTGLFDKLLPELPGILLWSIEGWKRLLERGHFVQPEYAAGLVNDLSNLSSPIKSFITSQCMVGQGEGFLVKTADLFDAWCSWCERQKHKSPGTEEAFGASVRAVVPELERKQRRESGARQWVYAGIRLRRLGEDEAHEPSSVTSDTSAVTGKYAPLVTTEVLNRTGDISTVTSVTSKPQKLQQLNALMN